MSFSFARFAPLRTRCVALEKRATILAEMSEYSSRVELLVLFPLQCQLFLLRQLPAVRFAGGRLLLFLLFNLLRAAVHVAPSGFIFHLEIIAVPPEHTSLAPVDTVSAVRVLCHKVQIRCACRFWFLHLLVSFASTSSIP